MRLATKVYSANLDQGSYLCGSNSLKAVNERFEVGGALLSNGCLNYLNLIGTNRVLEFGYKDEL